MIPAIENAILARIQAAPLGYALKKLATYGGEFSDGIDRIVSDFPAVLIAYSGSTLLQEARSSYTFKATFGIICCATSLRNEKTARHGKPGTVGSYQLITDMTALLSGQKLGLDITPLVPRAVRPLVNDKAGAQLASVYAIDFETNFSLGATIATDLDDFETFHADWDVPGFGNVQLPLPAEEADARDTVTLPIQEPQP